jgi:biopolymer transport protein ExbD
MSLRHRHARYMRKPAELMLVPMIDIFTVLVTFLLMTAVFSRIAIVELNLPSAASAPAATVPQFRLEVIVRQQGFELTNGTSVIAAIPKQADAYDMKALSELVASLKEDHPDVDDASVLLEPEIPYDDLIQVMDAVRSKETAADGTAAPKRVALFSNIAVGDAPVHGGTST